MRVVYDTCVRGIRRWLRATVFAGSLPVNYAASIKDSTDDRGIDLWYPFAINTGIGPIKAPHACYCNVVLDSYCAAPEEVILRGFGSH